MIRYKIKKFIFLSLQIPGSLIFHGYKLDDDTNYEVGRHLAFKLMYSELLLCIVLLPGLFLIRSNPKTPPSAFANTDIKIPFF